MADASALRARLLTGADDMMRAAVDDLMQLMLSKAPIGTSREGSGWGGGERLQESGFVRQVGSGERIVWELGFTAPQAEWTNDGTQPHPIDPIPPHKFLHWVTEMGEEIFARHVDHPGTTGTHWFDHALAEGWPAVLEDNLALLEAA